MDMMKNKNMKKMMDKSGLRMTGDKVAKQINSGVMEAEKELEKVSFIKKSGRADRRKDDVFNKIGL